MTELEKLVRSKFFFFKGTKHDCENFFDELEELQKGVEGPTSGYIKLRKSKKPVWYDSSYELSVLKDLDKCKFIKEIKTQSLLILYKKTKKYYPDIQLLLNDGSLVIIEVKPFMDMVNKKNLWKRKALRKYCREKGFSCAIIDKDYYSFDKDLVEEVVSKDIQMKFINLVQENSELSFDDDICKKFKEENEISDQQICNIIFNNKYSLKYQQGKIIFRKKKHI